MTYSTKLSVRKLPGKWHRPVHPVHHGWLMVNQPKTGRHPAPGERGMLCWQICSSGLNIPKQPRKVKPAKCSSPQSQETLVPM
jgi:hypothetical protein